VPCDVTIVVVTYNSSPLLGTLLESLPAALGSLSADVVVVDNGSSDGTADLAARRRDCRLVRSVNVGYAGGLNLGIRASLRTDAILVLNPDTRLDAGAIETMMRTLQEPGVGVVAPRILSPDGALVTSLRREPTLRRALGLSARGRPALSETVLELEEYERPRDVDWATGAVLLMSRDCYDAVGGWDESYFLYSEETDFCLRARELGWTTRYEPSAVAMHIGGGSGRNEVTHAMMAVNRVRLYARRHGRSSALAYLALSVLAEASWLVRGRSEARTAIRALLRPSARPPELGAGRRLIPQ